MKRISKYLVVHIVLLFTLFSCSEKPKQDIVAVPAKFIPEKLEGSILSILENKSSNFELRDTLDQFYAERKYKPLWSDLLLDKSKAKELFEFSNQFIKEEGLFLDFFNVDEILNYLPDTPYIYNDAYYEHLATAEIVVSNTLLHLHRDSKIGSLDPKELFGNAYELPQKKHEGFDLFSVLNPEKYQEIAREGTITDTNYVFYKDMLDSLYTIQARDTEYVQIDTTGILKIEVGDTTDILPSIANNLKAMGIISEKAEAKASSTTYNKEFKYYIRIAQSKFGLHDDGIIGLKSLRMFNQNISAKIDELKVNMERERWLERPKEQPFVLVNLPQYQLFLHYVDSVKPMDICIGKPRHPLYDSQMKKYEKTKKYYHKPRDFETPQIHSNIEYYVLNPTWAVPRSIVVREMFHQIRRDPNYLKENNYLVFRKKKLINPDSVNWRKYTATNVPFRFVQTWGDHNALGRVKFIFRNRHHIYFHDTPQQSRFKWTQRSVSHGCVRLADPMLMGDFITKEQEKVDYDDFRIMLGYEPVTPERLEEYDPLDSLAEIQKLDTTTTVHLQKKIPVYFLYRTVWYNEEGLAEFRADVYGKNEEILNTIKQKRANLPKF